MATWDTEQLAEAVRKHGGFIDEAKLHQYGLDPRQPELIYIPGLGAPAFQLERTLHKLFPIVGEVNTILQAQSNPWRAVAFWVLKHGATQNWQEPISVIRKRNYDPLLMRLANLWAAKY
jgi:hypothetical protein